MLYYDKGKNNNNRGQWLCEYGSSFVQIEVDVTYAYFFEMDTCGLKAFFKHQTHHPTKWDTVLKNIFFIFVSIYFSIGMTSIHFGIRHKDNIFWCQCTYLTT